MSISVKVDEDLLKRFPDRSESEDTTTHKITIRVVRCMNELEDLRAFWTSWQHHPNADIDFYLTMFRSNSQFIQPYVIVAYRGEYPEAMLIGRIEHNSIEYKLGYKTLFKRKARVLNFVYGGALGDIGGEANYKLVETVMDSLSSGEADIATFKYLRVDSSLYNTVTRLPGVLSRDYSTTAQTHRIMMLPRSLEEFRRVVPKKERKNHRWNRLLSDYPGKVRIKSFCDPAEVDRVIEDIEAVAKKTYQRGLGVGFINDASTRERLRLEGERGWLRAHILYIADVPCAFWLGTMYQGIFHGNFAGYDPDCGKYSPGMFLMMKVIEDLCSDTGERPSEIDWGLGDAQYKETLANSQWEEASINIFAPTCKGLTLSALMTLVKVAERLAKKNLARIELLTKLKKVWRRARTAREMPVDQSGKTNNPAGENSTGR